MDTSKRGRDEGGNARGGASELDDLLTSLTESLGSLSTKARARVADEGESRGGSKERG